MSAQPQRHILLFAHNFPPSNTSGVQRPLRFWKYLPEFGITAHVICSSQAGVDPSRANVHYAPGNNGYGLRTKSQVALARFIQRILPHNERVQWAPYAVAEADRLIKQFPISVVLSTFPPLGSHLAGMWTAARHGLPWIADYRDPLIGNAFRVRGGFLQHEEFSERRLFPRATVMTTVTDQIVAGWTERYPQYADKYRLLWNGFDPDEPFPAPAPKPNAPLTITHVGNIYGHRHPQHFLGSIERLIDAGKLDPAGIHVNLVGPLREPPEVKPLSSFTRLLEWGVLTFDGVNVPRPESLQYMADADYLLAIDINELNVSHSMPAKMFDYTRAKRPIIGLVPHNSIIENVLRKAEVEALFLYPDDTPEMQDKKLLEFISLPRRESIANEWFRQTFDGRRQAGTLAELIRSL